MLEILQETAKNSPNGSPDLQTLLNIMIPAIEYEDEEGSFIAYVSSKPGTRDDIVNLQRNLEIRLQERQAKSKGICEIREQLFLQCFNEIL